jgi:LemA protein
VVSHSTDERGQERKEKNGMKPVWIVLGVIALVVVGVGGMFVSTWNQLVTMDTDIKAKWAQIDNQLQRRADLIPNLVETVKGFAAQEKSILESIANARARLAGAGSVPDKIAASNELSGALSRLLVVVENYPNLKSDATFHRLMDELAGTENRLAVERKRYNDSVQVYNVAVRKFPGTLIAGILGFRGQPFFEVPAAARQTPQVKF